MNRPVSYAGTGVTCVSTPSHRPPVDVGDRLVGTDWLAAEPAGEAAAGGDNGGVAIHPDADHVLCHRVVAEFAGLDDVQIPWEGSTADSQRTQRPRSSVVSVFSAACCYGFAVRALPGTLTSR